MLHRNAAQRALEKELALLQKRDGPHGGPGAGREGMGTWKAKLEEKFRESVYLLGAGLLQSLCLVFEKGTGIIEKSYDRDALEKDYAVRDFAVQVKGDRRTLRRFPKENLGGQRKEPPPLDGRGGGAGCAGHWPARYCPLCGNAAQGYL